MRADRDAPALERVVRVGEPLGREALQHPQPVADEAEVARRGHPRVLLPQRPGGRVARVGERRLAIGDQRLVEGSELGDGEIDLAAHLQHLGDVVALQPLGDHGDRPDVGGHVLPDPAVAAGGGPDQPALLVDQVQRQPVHLQLAQVAGLEDPLLAQLPDGPRGPPVQLVAAEHVVQAHQPLQVLDRGERRRRRSTDLLGRRVRGPQRRVVVLDRVQLAHGRRRTRRRRSSARPARGSASEPR